MHRSISALRRWKRSYSTHMERFYRELGLSEGAPPSEIKQAYHRRALECHPDLHSNDGTEFRRVTEAYNTIMNGGKVVQYVRVSSSPQQTKIFQGPVGFWYVGIFLGIILFWYPSQMYLDNYSRFAQQGEPTRLIEPTRDTAKRERIAAILLERQRKEKEHD